MLALPAAAVCRCGELIRSRSGGRRPLAWRVAALLAIALLATMGPAQAADKASHFVLSNGMEVVVVPNHRVPIVTQQVWYKVGAAEDPDDQAGVAHFLEHLMFKGTKRFPDNHFERFMATNGGASVNAFTSSDHTYYPQSLPKRHLATLMELEADRMVNLMLREEHIGPEVRVVQNERRGNENSPAYVLSEATYAALFPNHPYGRSTIGTEAQIATLDRAKAVAFYKRYYAPNNAVLVVAGDVTESEVRALAERTFGRIPANKDLPKRVVHALPKQPATRRVELHHDRVTTPTVGHYYLTPGIGALPLSDAYALDILERIAGSSIIGRLYRSLITEKKLAVRVSASHWFGVQGGVLSFTATAAPGVTVADLEAALGREVAALGRAGVTEAEAEDAKQGYLATKAYHDDNHRSRAQSYGSALARGFTVADVEAENDRMARVTAADVNKVAARFIAKAEPVVAVLSPRTGR